MCDPSQCVCMCACVCDKEGDRKTGTQQRLQMGTTNKREEKKKLSH